MYDRKRYDTRMRDPHVARGRERGVRPGGARDEPRTPKEARIPRRPEERFEAKRAEEPPPRRERPAPPPEPKPGGRVPWRRRPDLWWILFAAWLVAVVWRFAAGAEGQGFLLLAAGLVAVLFLLGGMASKEDDDWSAIQRRRRRRRLRLPRLLRQRQHPRTATVPKKAAPGKAAAPKLVAPHRTRPRRPKKEGVAVAAVIGVLASVGGAAVKACKPDRSERPRTPRVVVPREVPPDIRDLLREVRPPANAWRPHLPPAAPGRVAGGVLLGGTTVLPHVEVVQVEGEGRGRSALTDEHGVFVFEGVEPGPCAFQVRGVVDVGGSRAAPTFGASGGRIEVDVPAWHALYLRREAGASLHGDATVQVARTNGDQRVQGRWKAGRTGAVLTGLRRDDYYDVLVQVPDAGVACLLERLPAGRDVPLELRRGVTIHGVVELGAGASHAALKVLLTHGGLQVEADLYPGGGFQADHLPRGSWWDVQAFTDGPNGRIGSERQGVHAGEAGRIELNLR